MIAPPAINAPTSISAAAQLRALEFRVFVRPENGSCCANAGTVTIRNAISVPPINRTSRRWFMGRSFSRPPLLQAPAQHVSDGKSLPDHVTRERGHLRSETGRSAGLRSDLWAANRPSDSTV